MPGGAQPSEGQGPSPVGLGGGGVGTGVPCPDVPLPTPPFSVPAFLFPTGCGKSFRCTWLAPGLEHEIRWDCLLLLFFFLSCTLGL